jgi:hypothetical protein
MRFQNRIGIDPPIQVVALDPFPPRLCFARELLEAASPETIQMGDGIITITVRNGRASYGITGENLMLNTICGVKSPDADADDG